MVTSINNSHCQKLKVDHVLDQVSKRLPLGYDKIIFPDITSLRTQVP